MKKQVLFIVFVLVSIVGFIACTKNESTTNPSTNTVTPKLEYATYTSFVDALKSQGYTQKDSLNSAEKAVLKRPVLTAQQLAANVATRLFFVKGSTDIIELVKKTTATWNLPDSIYNQNAVIPIGIYTNGAIRTQVTIEDNTLPGIGSVYKTGRYWDTNCKCLKPDVPPIPVYAN